MKNIFLHYFKADSYRRAAALLMFFCTTILLWSQIPNQAITDDDKYYAPAAISYVSWITKTMTHPADLLSQSKKQRQANRDNAFKPNHEHPPMAKYVMGFSHVLTTKLGIFKDLDGARSGTALFTALICAFMLLLLWKPLGPFYALTAPLMLLSLPRFFMHSQLATLDVAVSSMMFLCIVTFLWAEQSLKYSLLAAVLFGFALLTKLNAPFMAFIATVFLIFERAQHFKLNSFFKSKLQIPRVPWVLWMMAIIGPIMFIALWPWLWHDTLHWLGAYFAFHLKHYPILNFYEGIIYNKPYSPWHMPFVMAISTTPLPILFLGFIGSLQGVFSFFRIWNLQKRVDIERTILDKHRIAAFITAQAYFAIAIVAFSHVPKYGGEKLFMPFFPMFCVLAAFGFKRTFAALQRILKEVPLLIRAPKISILRSKKYFLIKTVLLLLVLLPGIFGIIKFSPGFGLSYYSQTIGGLRGAVARGMERTYYDMADKELALWLQNNAENAQVHFEPNHWEYGHTYKLMWKDGYLKNNFKLTRHFNRADYIVLTHERRWHTYPKLWENVQKMRIVYEKKIDGVPIYTVYKKFNNS